MADRGEDHTAAQNASGFILVTLITLIAGLSASTIVVLVSSTIVSNITIFFSISEMYDNNYPLIGDPEWTDVLCTFNFSKESTGLFTIYDCQMDSL